MTRQSVTQQQTPTTHPLSGGILQRKCASCGQHTFGSETCNQCEKGRNHSRTAISSPRFDQDFSQIPVNSTSLPIIQPKLTLGKPNDKYEQEAERVAEQVMRMPEPNVQQQKETEEEEEETLQAKPFASQVTPLVQRDMALEEEEILQTKRSSDSETAMTSSVNTKIQNLGKDGGQPIPRSVRAFMEHRFGWDFAEIRIHANKKSTDSANQLQAQAFTIGNNIFFKQNEFDPTTSHGKELLAHELTHTIQQQKQSNSSHSINLQRKISVDPKDKLFYYGTDEYIIHEATALPGLKINSIERLLREKYLVDFLRSDIKKISLEKEEIVLIDKEERLKIFRQIISKMEFSKEAFFFSNTQELANEVRKRLEIVESESEYFIEVVKRIRTKKGISIDEVDDKELRGTLELVPVQIRKKLEKELLTWPEGGQSRKMEKIIEIATSYSRKTDKEESIRGHFSEVKGEKLKNTLSTKAKEFGVNQCLKFLYQASLDELFADEEKKIEAAKSEYAEGAAKRKEYTIRHAKTLSRLASELRLQGLLGPVNILQWTGSGSKGYHQPAAGDLFERLSNAGDGWYFFLASQISFHTFVVGVHVSSGGTKRRYFEIQGGQTISMSQEELTKRFDERFANPERASSRVWQIYLRPTN